MSAAVLMLLFATTLSFAVEPERGSLCIDRLAAEPPQTAAPDFECWSGNYSFKIDARDVTPWPRAERLKIEGLDLKTLHRVRIFCDAKPHQTFTFRFSTFHLNELCLFINDFYQTAQLWRPAAARWCKCK